jgi:hypothetical protein
MLLRRRIQTCFRKWNIFHFSSTFNLPILTDYFEFNLKRYYRGKNSRMVLPCPSEREDADRQMGEDFRGGLKLLFHSFQSSFSAAEKNLFRPHFIAFD